MDDRPVNSSSKFSLFDSVIDCGNSEMRVLNYGLRKEFADRYNLDELMKANRLTDKQMAEDIAGILE